EKELDLSASAKFDPHPAYVVSIGEGQPTKEEIDSNPSILSRLAFWKDAGSYGEYWDLLRWIFFEEEGRAYAKLPGLGVKQIDCNINPTLEAERLKLPEHYFMWNSTIEG